MHPNLNHFISFCIDRGPCHNPIGISTEASSLLVFWISYISQELAILTHIRTSLSLFSKAGCSRNARIQANPRRRRWSRKNNLCQTSSNRRIRKEIRRNTRSRSTPPRILHKPRSHQIQRMGYCRPRKIRWAT